MKVQDLGLSGGDKVVYGNAAHPHGDRILSLTALQEAYGREPCDVVLMMVPAGKGEKVITALKKLPVTIDRRGRNKESQDGS